MFRQGRGIRSWRRYNSVLIMIFVVSALALAPRVSQAKADDDQTQIILLNDTAAALDDSDLALSQKLTKFADEREKEWEYKNANKDAPPVPITSKDMPRLQEEIKLLKAAALEVGPTYPLIAQSLKKMAHDINKIIEVQENK